MTRKCDPEKRNALKTALKRLVSDLGGLAAAASCTRVGTTLLSDYGNVDNERMTPVDVVLDLEMIGGYPHITSALASLQGYSLVMTEPKRLKCELAVIAARIGQDSAKLLGDAAAALAHERPTAAEMVSLSNDLAELGDVAGELREWLRREAARA
jgi:hypothetical protein